MWQDWFKTYKEIIENAREDDIIKPLEIKGCNICRQDTKGQIFGETIKYFNTTASYRPEKNFHAYKDGYDPKIFERLEIFLLKGKNDKYPGLMINTISGARYIDIKYCPICGRKLV